MKMRHGFSDNTSIDISADDHRRFATQDVDRLAGMIQPAWLDQEKQRSADHWQRNAAFALGQAIDSARFSLKAAAITDEQWNDALPVISAARAKLADIKATANRSNTKES